LLVAVLCPRLLFLTPETSRHGLALPLSLWIIKMNKVENLKKITLKLHACKTADNMDMELASTNFEFIFGIGPSGMCPFEYQLANKEAGEEISMQLKKEETDRIFEHLHLPIMTLLEEHDPMHIKVKILKIEQPDATEVVKALAATASHDHGCDCGCGC